jgi:D-glycero-alpha-D-manno-heptose-7-phosphate kinase
LIITRTPYRISFVGGGTDLREYYYKDDGMVLSTSINKYLYVIVKKQIGIVEFKYRINYSKVEFCNQLDEIEHPIVREALKFFKINFPIEITTISDVPGQTGLGSSSSFAVGLVNALFAIKGEYVTKHDIASTAAKIEIDILKRNMGKQDHFASAYGNINVITFKSNEKVIVDPVFHNQTTRENLESKLFLFYTKVKRDASEILYSQSKSTDQNRNILTQMKQFIHPLREVLCSGQDLNKIGNILDENWKLKKMLNVHISSTEIDNYYNIAKKTGSLGGKLLGAGGGGFLLFYIEKDFQEKVLHALRDLYNMPFKFDHGGTRITYYDQTTA